MGGMLYLEEPEARYEVWGDCRQIDSGYAEFWFTLVRGGVPYRGTIYQASDGQVYIEGTQDNTNISFVMQRR